ncbi:MAG: hypothetical protein WC700_04345 [Gemmatimonadaceae bacterium]
MFFIFEETRPYEWKMAAAAVIGEVGRRGHGQQRHNLPAVKKKDCFHVDDILG